MTMSEKLNQLKEYLLSQGSMAVAFVPSVVGLIIAGEVVKDLCNEVVRP
jgi:tRNA A37 threonylcarbamoyladenosine dehydratase